MRERDRQTDRDRQRHTGRKKRGGGGGAEKRRKDGQKAVLARKGKK